MEGDGHKEDNHQDGDTLFPFNADTVLDELFPSLGDGVTSGNPLARLLTSLGSGDDRGQGTSLFNPFNLSPPRLNEIHALATANLISQTQEAIMQEFDFSEFDFGATASSAEICTEDLPVRPDGNNTTGDYTLNSLNKISNKTDQQAVNLKALNDPNTETNFSSENTSTSFSVTLTSDPILEFKHETKNDQHTSVEIKPRMEPELEQAVDSITQDSLGSQGERKLPASTVTILNVPELQSDCMSITMTESRNSDTFVNNLPIKITLDSQLKEPVMTEDINKTNESKITELDPTPQHNPGKSSACDANTNNYSCLVNGSKEYPKEQLSSIGISQPILGTDNNKVISMSDHFQAHDKLITDSVEIETSIDLAHSENNAVFVCEVCLKQFSSSDKLVSHAQNHHKYVCPHGDCVKTCASRSHLQYHLKVHSGEKSHKCDECGQHFTKEQHLRTHRRTHGQDKQLFFCTQCGKGFSLEGNLRSHERLHSGEKPFACDHPGCEKRFAERASLKKHAVTHTGEKKYKCEVCNKGFTQACSRTVHMKRHRNDGQMKEG